MFSDLKFVAKKFISSYDVRLNEYKAARRFIPGDAYVLDAGCGTGTFISFIENDEAVGIDINPENVRFCQDQGITAREGNVLDLPF